MDSYDSLRFIRYYDVREFIRYYDVRYEFMM